MLCVNVNALPTCGEVNRKVDLDLILREHTKHYEDVSEARKDGYAPVNIATSVRSIYDNTVLSCNIEGAHIYYHNKTEIGPAVHKGLDLMMYVSSLSLFELIKYGSGVDAIMMKHSQFQPIGLYFTDLWMPDPIFYSHIIMSDEGMNSLIPLLKRGVKCEPIQLMKREGNISALLDTLILVRKDEHHE